METLFTEIVEAVKNGGPGTLAVVGWCLYIIERFYVGHSRDKNHKADLDGLRSDYKNLSENMVSTITKFTTLLEVIKDRGDRNN